MSITQDEKFKGNGDNLTKKRLILRSFDFPKRCKEFHEYFLTWFKTNPSNFFSHI